MKIGYICTNFNNSDVTIEAFESLLATSGHEYVCIAVDNASRQEERSKLTAYCATREECEVVLCEENLGYFNGLNQGLDHMRKTNLGVEWILIGNNDLEFDIGFANKLESQLKTFENHSVISPDIVTLDDDHQNPHVVTSISPLREFIYDLYYCNFVLAQIILKLVSLLPRKTIERGDETAWHTSQEIYQGHGSCYILSPKFMRTFERFWAPTFLYYEEFFLSHQLAQVGERVLYHPGLVVRHKCHSAFSVLPKRKVWEYSREAHRVYRKYVSINGPRENPPSMIPYSGSSS